MIILAGVLKLLFHHTPVLPRVLPESCVLIVIGMVIGLFVYFVMESESHHFPDFTSDIFFLYLLPPIILVSTLARICELARFRTGTSFARRIRPTPCTTETSLPTSCP